MISERKTIAGVFGVLLGVTTLGSGYSLDAYNKSVRELASHDFAETSRLYGIDDSLSSAAVKLLHYPAHTSITTVIVDGAPVMQVHHIPADYPDPAASKFYIQNALDGIKATDAPDIEDSTSILKEVNESLPNANEVSSYEGELVDNDTFKTQRENIWEGRNRFFSKFPEDFRDYYSFYTRLLAKRSAAISVGLFSFIMSLASLGIMVDNFRKRNNPWWY